MQQSITFWKRFSITIPLMVLLFFGATGARSYRAATLAFAQAQRGEGITTELQALNAIETAHEHYHERRYAEAIKAYQALLKTSLRPSQKDSIRLMLGQSYAKLGEDADARRLFKEIIDENPNGSYATQAVHRLGNLYRQRYQFREAIAQCKQILKQHPNTSAAGTAAFLIAQYEHTEGKYEKAIDSYKHFLDNFPSSPYRASVVNSLIRLYTENKHYAEAEKLIAARMQRYPADTTLLEQLAELYRQQSKSEKALELYRRAIEQDPGNTSIRRKLGALYVELGKTKQAVTEWQKVVTGETNLTARHQQLGEIYLSHKMYPEAIAAYRQAIRLSPQNGQLYIQLAAAYKIQGQIEKAAAIYLDALQRVGQRSGSSTAPVGLFGGNQREAIWAAMLEIYEGARQKPLREKLIAQLQKAQRTKPQNPQLTLTLGELFFYAGHLEQARETFTQLHRNYPSYIDTTLERYAMMLERNHISRWPAAIDFYKAVIQMSKNKAHIRNAQHNLAMLYQKMEQWQEAVALLKELVSTGAASVNSQLLLGQMQLHGLHAPKAAQMTFQPLLTRRLVASQLLEVQLGLGECHLLLKRYTLAREVLTPIADNANRFSAAARKLIGDSYFFAADFENAVKAYKQGVRTSKSDRLTNDALERIVLIQNHPDYLKIPLTDYATALQLYLSGQTGAALEQCERTLEAYPQALIVDDIKSLTGDIYREAGKDADAIEAYQQVIAQQSSLATKALINIAEIYRHQDDLANAASAYTTLITNYPENVIVVHARQQLDEIAKLQQKRSTEDNR